jgi:ATP-dependent Clp protease protease subunit
MQKFWNWVRNQDGGRTLYLDGIIASETWLDDDISPAAFREDLYAGGGPVTIFINSPGGDCFAASQIYTMLLEYPHDVTIKIDGIAASAASVIAMAGTQVLMAPTALMMMHRPLTVAVGNSDDMQKAIHMLDEVQESIINAYQLRTGLPRGTLSQMMESETWLSASKAVELKFADGVLERQAGDDPPAPCGYQYSSRAAIHVLLNKLSPPAPQRPGTPVADLDKRLALLHYRRFLI